MAVTVLETLSPEELVRYRAASASLELARNPPPNLDLSGEEIRQIYLDYWGFCAKLMMRHGVEGEEAEEAKISLYTGNIYIGAEG